MLFLVYFTSIDNTFIQCGLDEGEPYKQKFSKYKDLKYGCNLSGSEFDNVNISGMNLNRALLLNCKWENIRILELYQLYGNNSPVRSVCISPNGYTLASGQRQCYSTMDLKTGQQKVSLDGQTSVIMSVCFYRDGNTLATRNADNSISLWDVNSKKKIAKLEGHTNHVNSVCFSPDGIKLAFGSNDNSIRLLDFKTGQQTAKLNGHTNWVNSVCFSPDGNKLISGCKDGIKILTRRKWVKGKFQIIYRTKIKKTPPQYIHCFYFLATFVTILLISILLITQLYDTIIFQSQFITSWGENLI
ncbi:unnamed protein product [Paramecium primaurelia]|uniref:Uncharacterized protein n=1 Tax=Paramecium primaurelia TaxID=5886 RepID=A0A8S1N7M7_PARPR|nr:unnamed protein product [Paramecium primaurelia]